MKLKVLDDYRCRDMFIPKGIIEIDDVEAHYLMRDAPDNFIEVIDKPEPKPVEKPKSTRAGKNKMVDKSEDK